MLITSIIYSIIINSVFRSPPYIIDMINLSYILYVYKFYFLGSLLVYIM